MDHCFKDVVVVRPGDQNGNNMVLKITTNQGLGIHGDYRINLGSIAIERLNAVKIKLDQSTSRDGPVRKSIMDV